MDVKIQNGSIVRDVTGREVTVSGFEETVQRVTTVCSLKKGSFRYQRDMGVDTDGLEDDERLAGRLELRLQEAIVAIPDVCVTVLEVSRTDAGLSAVLQVSSHGQSTQTEVTLYGSI